MDIETHFIKMIR